MASSSELGVVLVVGGCGYLGSNLVKALQAESTCTAIHGLIPSRTSLAQANVDGIRNLLKATRETENTRAFIYTGSHSALEQMPVIKQTEETAKLYSEFSKDANPYAKSKAIADAEVQAADTPSALTTAVIRIPELYGENDDNCVGTLLDTIKKGQHNACEAHILAAKRILEGRLNGGQAFFISDGVSLPYFDFARKLYAGAGHPVPPDQIKVMPLWLVVSIAQLGE
ncbi:hydroxysteroid dehydrogenase, putative [Talaromyces marneffei ATCC 18224]|uniref:Hydroxysteroid dehydrogenase, putative n=1 Tax=Talaromyces marneffei (strain ATCC 18224 / CBS 334.59 / QM 7333) TaxID=441960 RepID=B6QA77_TALMQ|nr:hydroxysteroid dehydrogenase, putative [Talaromyces marneffei ATCC 18224]